MNRYFLEIKEPPKSLWAILILAALLLLIVPGCKPDQVGTAISGDIWLHDQIPSELCKDDSEMWNHGIYRRITCTTTSDNPECKAGKKTYDEYVSYCNTAIKQYLSMHKKDKQAWVDWASQHCN